MSEWEIKKTLGQCYITEQPFEVGQEYFAALVQTNEGFERRDYCSKAWEQHKPEVYCFWKTRLPDASQKKKLLVSDEMLMAFFDRLAEETDQEKINFRYTLTLILMRKRKLKYESADFENDQEIWILRVPGENRMVKVIDPHLSEDQIDELSEQMGQILQMDFDE